jgi:hypothetical protein
MRPLLRRRILISAEGRSFNGPVLIPYIYLSLTTAT